MQMYRVVPTTKRGDTVSNRWIHLEISLTVFKMLCSVTSKIIVWVEIKLNVVHRRCSDGSYLEMY